MLAFSNLPQYLWAEAVSTACFTQNRSFIHRRFNVTPYEIINNRKPNVKFFHVFGCRCFIMNLKDNLSKFQTKADEGIFMGYSHNSVAYRVLNKRTRKVEETFNLTFDDHYIKKSNHKFVNYPILQNSSNIDDSIEMNDVDYDLIFGILEQAIDAERNATDNQTSENSKYNNDSTSNLSQNPNEQADDPVEGEHLDSNAFVEGEHYSEQDNMSTNVSVEEEQILEEEPISKPEQNIETESIIEGEPILENDPILEEEHFDDADDSISINGSEIDVMFEDALLDFDLNYPPLDKWTRNHPKDQILGDPQAGIMTRAQLHA